MSDLVSQLEAWGQAHNMRFVYRERVTAADHPITRAREFAPMTKKKAEKKLVGRDGGDRRRAMAAAAGVSGMHIVPMWACDPIPSKGSGGGGGVDCAVDVGVPEHLRWIDRALSQLSRINLIRAMCLREEYCGTGTQRDKAARVAETYGGELSVWMYRKELDRARDFLDLRQAEAA